MKIKDTKKMCELYAHYWIAMATTGANKNRNVTDGHGTPLTDEELIQDAMDTALRHIHMFMEAAEAELQSES